MDLVVGDAARAPEGAKRKRGPDDDDPLRSRPSRRAKDVLRRIAEATSRRNADPLAIARDERGRLLRSGGHLVTVALVRILLSKDGLIDSLSHLCQTALFLLLRLEEGSFFPGEWAKAVDLLVTSRLRKSGEDGGGWAGPFREVCLRGFDDRLRPLSAPDWLSGEVEEPGDDDEGERPPPPRGRDAEDSGAPLRGSLLLLLAEVEAGKADGIDLARLRSILSDLADGVADSDGAAIPATAVSDETLSLVTSAFLEDEDEATAAQASAFVEILVKAKAKSLEKSPSQALVTAVRTAAANHPRAVTRTLLGPLVGSAALNLAQVELLKKVIFGQEFARFGQGLVADVLEVEEWRETHLLALQHIIQSSAFVGEETMGLLCGRLRARRQIFASSLQFAKLVKTVAQRFPREARGHKTALLDALEANTTFLCKAATACAKKL